tara:strand:- start:1790 stop:2170 length:381 start_codon:yes stop_codon:yes gene_type:complete
MTDIVTVTIDDTFPVKGPSVFNGVLLPVGEYHVQCDLDIEVTKASNRHEPWSDDDAYEIIVARPWTEFGDESKIMVWFIPDGGEPEPWYDHATEVDQDAAQTVGGESLARWFCEDLDLASLTDGLH